MSITVTDQSTTATGKLYNCCRNRAHGKIITFRGQA